MLFKRKTYDIKKGEDWLTREQIGLFLFTRENLLESNFKKKILKMLQEFQELIKPEQLDLIRTGPKTNSYKNYTQNSFKKFEKQFENFKYKYDPDNRIFD